MSALSTAKDVQAIGFKIAESPNPDHFTVNAKRGQVGVYRLDSRGILEWGWVETPNGRIDVHNLMDFRAALETVPR